MNETPIRSTFVTVVAWIFIVLSGFTTVISLLQNIMLRAMFDDARMGKTFHEPPSGSPPFAAFMVSHFQLFLLMFLVASTVTLASSIGLLRRMNWARWVFVGLMALGIVWNVGGLVLQFGMFSSMQDRFVTAPGMPNMRPFFIAVAVVSVVFALAFSGLFGWIAARLLSSAVAAEFRRQP